MTMVTPYATVLADPPWNIQQIGTGSPPYDLMTVDQIAALPVGALAKDDAHLWLWVTNASLFAGRQVLQDWGFTYRSVLTWIKPRFGMGHWLRNQTEHVLLGTRGNAPILFRGQGSWFYAPVQEHSHKPEEQYAIIERCSPGPFVELFARRPRRGWHVWGNQVASDLEFGGDGAAGGC
jgi:N6-adenosine-specific RNA methylase IME4